MGFGEQIHGLRYLRLSPFVCTHPDSHSSFFP